MESIKAKAVAKSADDVENSRVPWEKATGTPAWEKPVKTSVDVQSNKLKQLLGQIKQG